MKARLLTLTTAVLGTAAAFAAATLARAAAPAPLADAAAQPAAPATPAVAFSEPSKDQLSFFENKVRPVLVANCYKCHSAADGKAKGGLVLDTREGWQHGGDTGAALVPGKPDASLLVKAIGYNDPDLQMPPNGKKLSPQEVADLTTWVKMGAPDPRTNGGVKLSGLTDKARAHWAYQPVKEPAVPAIKDARQVKSPVDNFVLAKLEAAGMTPSRPAAREALIRRASYDLTGLPPTPEEVRAFQNDYSAAAFEKVIDRLLASPAYGERWGRFWLDSARYSDTTGIEGNNKGGDYRYAHAWTYRDYVIKAFNDDKPYDQFLKEQVAADQLPTAKTDPGSLAALGFITVGKRFQNPNDQIDERIDTLGKATMAMTIACSRCHDHKFDPIPTADYYSLHGVFNSLVEPKDKPLLPEATPVMSSEDVAERADFEKQLAGFQGELRAEYYKAAAAKYKEFQKKPGAYLHVGLMYRKNDVAATKARNQLIAEHKLDRDVYQTLRINPRTDLAVYGPLMQFADLSADAYEKDAEALRLQVAAGSLPGAVQRKGRPVPATKVNPLVAQAFAAAPANSIKSLADAAAVYGKLITELAPKQAAYLEACKTANESTIPGFPPELVEMLNVPMAVHPANEVTADTIQSAINDLQLVNGGYQRFRTPSAINELLLTHPGAPARAMVVADAETPKNSPIFIRGEAQNRGPVVPRRFLEIIAGKDRKPFTQGAGRLELAEAIASPTNPLTARVAVNRIWAHHFGEGFVQTLDDLGTMCETPSHPELLDYLASRFVASGWSYKAMHKLIMLSSTYQQSSDTNAAYALKDPSNRLLWRATVRRLDFEAVRDTMLQYTGKIDRTVGGKPVNLTDEPYSYRRSVYGYVDRGQMPELMQQFDYPDADMANSHRASTIVPQQALFFMNSPMSVDVARKVTTRPEFVTAKDDMGRVKALYEVLFQRAPKAAEVALARDFIVAAQANAPEAASAKTLKQAGKGGKFVEAKIKGGNQRSAIKNSGELVERKPLNAWEQFAQTLLMTNEIVYVN
jgi:hypothetical protein